MYVCGNRPDHVTRYNHKNTDRGLTPPAAYKPTTLATAFSTIALTLSVACVVTIGVMLLQSI